MSINLTFDLQRFDGGTITTTIDLTTRGTYQYLINGEWTNTVSNGASIQAYYDTQANRLSVAAGDLPTPDGGKWFGTNGDELPTTNNVKLAMLENSTEVTVALFHSLTYSTENGITYEAGDEEKHNGIAYIDVNGDRIVTAYGQFTGITGTSGTYKLYHGQTLLTGGADGTPDNTYSKVNVAVENTAYDDIELTTGKVDGTGAAVTGGAVAVGTAYSYVTVSVAEDAEGKRVAKLTGVHEYSGTKENTAKTGLSVTADDTLLVGANAYVGATGTVDYTGASDKRSVISMASNATVGTLAANDVVLQQGNSLTVNGRTIVNSGATDMTVTSVGAIEVGGVTYFLDEGGVLTKTASGTTTTYAGTSPTAAALYADLAAGSVVIAKAENWETGRVFALTDAGYTVAADGTRTAITSTTTGEFDLVVNTTSKDWKLVADGVVPTGYTKYGDITIAQGKMTAIAFDTTNATASNIKSVFNCATANSMPIVDVGSATVSGFVTGVLYRGANDEVIEFSADGTTAAKNTFQLTDGVLKAGEGLTAAEVVTIYAGDVTYDGALADNAAGSVKSFVMGNALEDDPKTALTTDKVLGDASLTITKNTVTSVTIGDTAYELTHATTGTDQNGIKFSYDATGDALYFGLDRVGEAVKIGGGAKFTATATGVGAGVIVKTEETDKYTIYGGLKLDSTKVAASDGKVYDTTLVTEENATGEAAGEGFGGYYPSTDGELSAATNKLVIGARTYTEGKNTFYYGADKVDTGTLSATVVTAAYQAAGYKLTVESDGDGKVSAGVSSAARTSLGVETVDYSGFGGALSFDEGLDSDSKLKAAIFDGTKSQFKLTSGSLSDLTVKKGDDADTIGGEVTVSLLSDGDAEAAENTVLLTTVGAAAVLTKPATDDAAGAASPTAIINGVTYAVTNATGSANVKVTGYSHTDSSNYDYTSAVSVTSGTVIAIGDAPVTYKLSGAENEIAVENKKTSGTATLTSELMNGVAVLESKASTTEAPTVNTLVTSLDGTSTAIQVAENGTTEGVVNVTVKNGAVAQVTTTAASVLKVDEDSSSFASADTTYTLASGAILMTADFNGTKHLCLTNGTATVGMDETLYIAKDGDLTSVTTFVNTSATGNLTVEVDAATGTYSISGLSQAAGSTRTFTIDGVAYSSTNNEVTLKSGATSSSLVGTTTSGTISSIAIIEGTDGVDTGAEPIVINADTAVTGVVHYGANGAVVTSGGVATLTKTGTGYALTVTGVVEKGIVLNGAAVTVSDSSGTANSYVLGDKSGNSYMTFAGSTGSDVFTTTAANVVEVTSGTLTMTKTGSVSVGKTSNGTQSVFTLTDTTDTGVALSQITETGVYLVNGGATVTATSAGETTIRVTTDDSSDSDFTLTENSVVTNVETTVGGFAASLTSGSARLYATSSSVSVNAGQAGAVKAYSYAPESGTTAVTDGVLVTVSDNGTSVTGLGLGETVTAADDIGTNYTYSVVEAVENDSTVYYIKKVTETGAIDGCETYSGPYTSETALLAKDVTAADTEYDGKTIWSTVGVKADTPVVSYYALTDGKLVSETSVAQSALTDEEVYLQVTCTYVAEVTSGGVTTPAHYDYTLALAKYTSSQMKTDNTTLSGTSVALDLTAVPFTGNGTVSIAATSDDGVYTAAITNATFAIEESNTSGTVTLNRAGKDSVTIGTNVVALTATGEVKVDGKGMISGLDTTSEAVTVTQGTTAQYTYTVSTSSNTDVGDYLITAHNEKDGSAITNDVHYIAADRSGTKITASISATAAYDKLTSEGMSDNLLTRATFPAKGYYIITTNSGTDDTKESDDTNVTMSVSTPSYGGVEGAQKYSTASKAAVYYLQVSEDKTLTIGKRSDTGEFTPAATFQGTLTISGLSGTYEFASDALGTGKAVLSDVIGTLSVKGLTKDSTAATTSTVDSVSLNGAEFTKVASGVDFKVQEDTTVVHAILGKERGTGTTPESVTVKNADSKDVTVSYTPTSTDSKQQVEVTSAGMVTGIGKDEVVKIGDYYYKNTGTELVVGTDGNTFTTASYKLDSASPEVSISVSASYDDLTAEGMSTHLLTGTKFPEAGYYLIGTTAKTLTSGTDTGYALTSTTLPTTASGVYLKLKVEGDNAGAEIVKIAATDNSAFTESAYNLYTGTITLANMASESIALTGINLGSGGKVAITSVASGFSVTGLPDKSTVDVADAVYSQVTVNAKTVTYEQVTAGMAGAGATITADANAASGIAVTGLNSASKISGFDGTYTINGKTVTTTDTSLSVAGNSGKDGIGAVTGLDAGSTISGFDGSYSVNGQSFSISSTGTKSLTVTGATDGIADISGLASGQSFTYNSTDGFTVNGKTITLSTGTVTVNGGAENAVSISGLATGAEITINAADVAVTTAPLSTGDTVTVNGVTYESGTTTNTLVLQTTANSSILSTGTALLSTAADKETSLTLADGTTLSIEDTDTTGTATMTVAADGTAGASVTIAASGTAASHTFKTVDGNGETVTYVLKQNGGGYDLTVSGSASSSGNYSIASGTFTIKTNYGGEDVVSATAALTKKAYYQLDAAALASAVKVAADSTANTVVYGDGETLATATKTYLTVTRSGAGTTASPYTYAVAGDTTNGKDIVGLDLTNFAGSEVTVANTGLTQVFGTEGGTITLPDGTEISKVQLGSDGTLLQVSADGVVGLLKDASTAASGTVALTLASKGEETDTELLVNDVNTISVTLDGAGNYVLGGLKASEEDTTRAEESIALSGSGASVVATVDKTGISAVAGLGTGETITGWDGNWDNTSYTINGILGSNDTVAKKSSTDKKETIELTVTGKTGGTASSPTYGIASVTGLKDGQTISGYDGSYTINGQTITATGADDLIVTGAEGSIAKIEGLDTGETLATTTNGVTIVTDSLTYNSTYASTGSVTINGTKYAVAATGALTVKTSGTTGAGSILTDGAVTMTGSETPELTIAGKTANTTIQVTGGSANTATVDAKTGVVTFTADGTYTTSDGTETVTYVVSNTDLSDAATYQTVVVTGSASINGTYRMKSGTAAFAINTNGGAADTVVGTKGTTYDALDYEKYTAGAAMVRNSAMDVVYGSGDTYTGSTVYFTVTPATTTSYTIAAENGTWNSAVTALDISAFSGDTVTFSQAPTSASVTVDENTTVSGISVTSGGLTVTKGTLSGTGLKATLASVANGTADLALGGNAEVTLSSPGSYTIGGASGTTALALTATGTTTGAKVTAGASGVTKVATLNGSVTGFKGSADFSTGNDATVYTINAKEAADGVTVTGNGTKITITGLDVDEKITVADGVSTTTYVGVSDQVVKAIVTGGTTKLYQLNTASGNVDLLDISNQGTEISVTADWASTATTNKGTTHYFAADGSAADSSNYAFSVMKDSTSATYYVEVKDAVNQGVMDLSAASDFASATFNITDASDGAGTYYWLGTSSAVTATGVFQVASGKVSRLSSGSLTVATGSVDVASTFTGSIGTSSAGTYALNAAVATVSSTQGISALTSGSVTSPIVEKGEKLTVGTTTYTASESGVIGVTMVGGSQTIAQGSILVTDSGTTDLTTSTGVTVDYGVGGDTSDGAGITVTAGNVTAVTGLTDGESVAIKEGTTTTTYTSNEDGTIVTRKVATGSATTIARRANVSAGSDVVSGTYTQVANAIQSSTATFSWTNGTVHYFAVGSAADAADESTVVAVNTSAKEQVDWEDTGKYYLAASSTSGTLTMGLVQIDYLGNAQSVAGSTFKGTAAVDASSTSAALTTDLGTDRGYAVTISGAATKSAITNLLDKDTLTTKTGAVAVTVDGITYQATNGLTLVGGDVDVATVGVLNVMADTDTAVYNNITVRDDDADDNDIDTKVTYAAGASETNGVTVTVTAAGGITSIQKLANGESVTLSGKNADGSTFEITYLAGTGTDYVTRTTKTTKNGETTTVVERSTTTVAKDAEIYSGVITYTEVGDATASKDFAWAKGTYDYIIGSGAKTDVTSASTTVALGTDTTTSAYSYEDYKKYLLRAEVSDKNVLTLSMYQINSLGEAKEVTDGTVFKGTATITGGDTAFTYNNTSAGFTAALEAVPKGSAITLKKGDTVETAALSTGDTVVVNDTVYTAGADNNKISLVRGTNDNTVVKNGTLILTGSLDAEATNGTTTTTTTVIYTAGSAFDGAVVTVENGSVKSISGLTGGESVTLVEKTGSTTTTTTYAANTEGNIITRTVKVGSGSATPTVNKAIVAAGSDVMTGNYNIIGDAYVSQLDWTKAGDSYFDAAKATAIATVAKQDAAKEIYCTTETQNNLYVQVTLSTANTISSIGIVGFNASGELVASSEITSGTITIDAADTPLKYAAVAHTYNFAVENVGGGANISGMTSADKVTSGKLETGEAVTVNGVVYTNGAADGTLSVANGAVIGTVIVSKDVTGGDQITAGDGETKVTAKNGNATVVSTASGITSLTDIGEGEIVTVVEGDYETTYTGKSTGIQVLTNDPTKKSGVIESSTPTSVNVITGTVTAYADSQTLTAFTWDAGGYVVAGAGAAAIPGSGTLRDADKTVTYEAADKVYIHGTKETDGSYTFVTQKVSALGKLEDTTDYALATIAAKNEAMKMDVAKVAADITNVAADSVITGVSEDDTVRTQSSLTAGDSITLTDTSGKTHVIEAGGTGSIVINGEGVCTQGTLNLTKDTNGGIMATDGTGVAVTKGAVRVTYGDTATIDAGTLGNDDVVTYKAANGTERTVSIKQTGDNAYNVTKKEGTSTQIVKNVAASQLGNIVTTGGEGLDWKDAAAVDNMFNWADESSGYFMVTAANFANSKTVVKIADQTTKNTDATNMANVGNYFFKAAVEGNIESGKSLALTIQQMTIQDGLIVMEDVDASKFGGTIQITAPTATGLTFKAGDFTAATIHVVGVSGASDIQGIGADDTVETAAKLSSDAAVTVNDHTYTVEAGTAKAVVNGTGTAGSGSSAIESGVVTVTDAAVGTASTVTAGSDTSATVTFARGAATSITNMGAGESVTVEGTNAGTYTMLSDTGVQKGTQVRELSKANANIIASSGWKDVSFDDFKITSKGVGYFLVSAGVSEMLEYLAGEGAAPTSPLTIDIRTDATYTKPNADGASYAGKYFVQVTTTDAKNGVSNISKIALVKLAADGKATTVSSLKLADIGAFLNMTANSSVKFSGQTNVPDGDNPAYTLNGLGQVVSGTMSMNSTAKTMKTAAGETIAYTGKDGVTVVVENGATSVTGLTTDKESVKITDANGLVTTFTNNGGTVEEKQGSVLIRKTTESATDETNVLDKTLYTAASFKSSFSFGKSQVGYFEAYDGYAEIKTYSGEPKSVDSDTVVITMSAANTIASITGASAYTIDANKKALVFDKATAASEGGTFDFSNVGGKANFQNLASGDTVGAVKGATVTIGSNVYAVSGDGAAFKGDGELTDGTVTLTSGKATYYATVGGKSIAVTGKSITVTAVGGEITSIGGLAAGATFYYDGVAHTVANVDKTLSLVKSDGSTYQTVAVSSKSVNLEDGAITGWSAERAITVPATVTVALSKAAKTTSGSFVYDVTNMKTDKVAAVVGSSYDTTKVAVGTVSAASKTYTAVGDAEKPAQNITGVAGWNITGGAGNDTIAAKGYDTIDGGAGNDSITGGSKYNYYAAGNGNDTIKGFAAGSDTLVLGNGYTEISYENNGKDVKLATSDGSVTLVGMANKEVDIASENGAAGTAHFFGGTGAVKFTTYVDGAYYHGGTGSSLKFGTNNLYRTAKNESETNVNVDLSDARFANINMVDGSGSANRMVLTAGDSAATLKGGSYVSTLTGGSGNDSLVGGSGNDTFLLDSFAGTDTISSYKSGKDVLVTSENFEVQLSTGTDVVLKSGDNSVTLAKAGSTAKPVEIKTDVESASKFYYFGKDGADDTFTYTVAKGSESLVSGISENYYYYGGTAKSKGDTLKLASSGAVGANDITGDGEKDLFTVSLEDNANLNGIEVLDASGLKKTGKDMSYTQLEGSTGSSTLVGGANSVDKFKIADGAVKGTNTTIRNFSVDDVIELGAKISDYSSTYSSKGTEITLDNGATVNVVGMTKSTYDTLSTIKEEQGTQISYKK